MRIKMTVLAAFREDARRRGFENMEGRFFAQVYEEWKTLRASQPQALPPIIDADYVGRGVQPGMPQPIQEKVGNDRSRSSKRRK